MTESQSSSSILKIMRSRRKPALFTRMSSAPNVSTACSTSRRAPSQSATSSWLAMALPPAAAISSTTCCAGLASAPVPSAATPRSFTTTAAPSFASCSASARPSPRPAPVTIAALPSSISLEPLDNRARGQRSAAAHRDQRDPLAGALELVQGSRDQAAAGGADRVAESDGAAVHVHLVHVRLVHLRPGEDDGGKRLVYL